ncbi:MAG: hypothetical protein HYT80_10525 [Euryarchaeota archaeon]|nr:hypothetical protein [Euryarchaeota archaeon]
MTTPPLFSTFSALTELAVTAAVFWFFYHALGRASYRWGVITVAIVYETLFNITYMVLRLVTHEEGVTHDHPIWVTWFVGVHGALSLLMFVGLIAFVAWAHRAVRRGEAHPVGAHPRTTWAFLGVWTLSILSGEAIYAFYWMNIIT